MSTTVRVRRRIGSLDLPELAEFPGKEVHIWLDLAESAPGM